MFSAFQSNAFQSPGFQVVRGGTPPEPDNGWMGGPKDGWHYHSPYQKTKEEQYQRERIAKLKAEQQRLDDEIAEAEARRLAELAKLQAKRLAAKKRAALEAIQSELLEQINLLRIQRAALIQRINEEESILVILLMAKRRRFSVV